MSVITHISQLDLTKTYTYADYLTWRLDEVAELVKGKVRLMSPAPLSAHQTFLLTSAAPSMPCCGAIPTRDSRPRLTCA